MHMEFFILENADIRNPKLKYINLMLLLILSAHETAIFSWHYQSIKPGSSLTQNIPYLVAKLLSWYVVLKSFIQMKDLIYFSS